MSSSNPNVRWPTVHLFRRSLIVSPWISGEGSDGLARSCCESAPNPNRAYLCSWCDYWGAGTRTKSFSPSTSFAVLWTVPSLLGGFSRGPSLLCNAGFEGLRPESSIVGLDGLRPASSIVGLDGLRPKSSGWLSFTLVCFGPVLPPFCCSFDALLAEPPAVPGLGPPETFW